MFYRPERLTIHRLIFFVHNREVCFCKIMFLYGRDIIMSLLSFHVFRRVWDEEDGRGKNDEIIVLLLQKGVKI